LGNGLVARLREDKGEISLGGLSLPLETLRQGGWMLITTVIAGILYYLSNVFVGRMLGPADYSVFTSLLSLSMILTVVTGVVQTVVTNYVARLRGRGATAEVGALFVYLLKRLLPWGIGGALVLSLIARPLAAFLQIPSLAPVVVFSTFLIPTAVLPAVNGVQRGLQRFGALGWTQVSVAAFRLVAVVGLIILGLGATGAVAALPLSGLGAFALGMILLADVLRQRESRAAPRLDGLFAYSLNAILALACFAVLTNGDVILVKSRFTPTESGLYSAVATLGKTTLWLSSAVVMLLLPKVTEQHAHGQPTLSLVRKSLLAVGLLCGGVTSVFFLSPSFIVEAMFGRQYLNNASLLGWYGLAMTFYSLVNVWLVYYIAIQEKRYAYILSAGVVLLVISLTLWVFNLTQVVMVMVGVGGILCLGGEILSRGRWQRSANP
jgi:O-antigen/teichoic acid export membrane protein